VVVAAETPLNSLGKNHRTTHHPVAVDGGGEALRRPVNGEYDTVLV